MKYKTYNIEIDGSSLTPVGPTYTSDLTSRTYSKPFEDGVAAILDSVWARKVGRQVFDNFPKDKAVTILPRARPSGPFVPDVCNASAEPPKDGKPGAIFIDPQTWKPGSECNPAGSAGTNVDEVLLHELLHTYRQLSGHEQGDAFNVPPEKQYKTIEDFWAIVVTNVYMSEKGKTLLRRDHANYGALPPKWSTSTGFLSDADLLRWSLAILNQEEKLLKGIDSSIPATTPFNPFHMLLTDRQKYELRNDINKMAQDNNRPGPTP